VVQPIREISEQLAGRTVYFHTDAAQGFAKESAGLRNERIDLISISAHKISGPKGIGALIVRRRGQDRPPLTPLMFGGGHERGLRPGTLPVALIAGFGHAAELWAREAEERWRCGLEFRRRLLEGLAPLRPVVNGDEARCLPFILNVSIPGTDSESIMSAWSDLVAVSSGAACSSHSYTCSHVLAAMGIPSENAASAIRFSWCHMSEMPDTAAMVDALQQAGVH
jgi:cysteine desulfurase